MILLLVLVLVCCADRCNITSAKPNTYFYLSRCTFAQTGNQVTVNITFVVIDDSYAMANRVRHYR